MNVLAESRWLIWTGTLVTARVFLMSVAVAAILALALGLMRQSKAPLVCSAAIAWVEFFRGISTVVLLFWLYFALPAFGISLQASTAAVLGLGLVHGAYGSEVVRGAMQSVGRDQWEAAVALGYTRRQTLYSIILPQAFVRMLPPAGNSLVLLLKGTSIASIITVPELTFQSSLVVTRTLAVVPIFTCILIIYYGMAMVTVTIIRRLEIACGRWRPQIAAAR